MPLIALGGGSSQIVQEDAVDPLTEPPTAILSPGGRSTSMLIPSKGDLGPLASF